MKFLKKLPLRVLLALPLLWLLGGCAVYDHIMHPHRLPTPKMDPTAKAKAKAAEKARHKGLSLKSTELAKDESAAEATASGREPGAPAPAADAAEPKKTMSYSELPAGTKLKYDKQGLVKKSFLDRKEADRRKLHHYDTRPLTPREASHENRKIRKKGHTDHGKGKADPKGKAEPLDPALDLGPDPGPPATTPTAPSESAPGAPAASGAPRKGGAARARPVKAPVKAPKKVEKAPRAPKPALPEPAPEPAPVPKKAAKKAPKADPTQPAPEPVPAPAPKKAGKAPKAPKPDPTQPAPGQ